MGINIRRCRIEKGLTQEKLAYELGVSAQAVSHWENNITYPDISMLPIIADYFEVSIDELMGWVKECFLEEREACPVSDYLCIFSEKASSKMNREQQLTALCYIKQSTQALVT